MLPSDGIRQAPAVASREGLLGPPIHRAARPGYDRLQWMAHRVRRTRRAVGLAGRVRRENLSRLRQVLVLQIVRLQQANERIAEEILILPVVETPRHFLQVGGKMFHRDLVPRANDPALKERERRFNRVRGYAQAVFIADVLFGLVIDALVLHVAMSRGAEVVELRLVGHDDIDRLVNVAGDNLVHLFLIQRGIGFDEMKMPAAFADADYWRVFLPFVGILGVTSDVHLIDFDRARELVFRFFHRFANAVTEIPRRLVRDAEHSFDLVGRDALARFGNQVGDKKPLRERQMRVMEDRSHGYRELVLA